MTILASTIIDRVSKQLADITNVVWDRAQLLDWLSVGQRFIVSVNPAAGSTTITMKLATGTRQVIADASTVVTIFDVVRNMGTDGLTPGRAIRRVDRELFDRCEPAWHSAAASGVTQSYMLDPAEPSAFWVYPPSNGTNYVQLRLAQVPPPLVAEAAALTVSDNFEDPLMHYVMFRALSKHAQFSQDDVHADKYLALFNAAVGATAPAQQAVARNG